MNCSEFQELIGMRCNPIGDALEIITPFTFTDGDAFEIFAQKMGPQILFFDDGLTLEHLHNVGINIGIDQRKWQPIRSIAENHGVTLSDDGVLEVLCSSGKPSGGLAQLVSTLMDVASWEKTQTQVSLDADFLIEEVAFYLHSWKPESVLEKKVKVKGFSGRTLTFDFCFEGQLIDAIQPHSNSTGATLRKIVDFQSAAQRTDFETLIIVDDRQNSAGAKQEIDILGRITKAWRMSSLVSISGAMTSQ